MRLKSLKCLRQFSSLDFNIHDETELRKPITDCISIFKGQSP